ncbi:MAG: hypothetical protein KBT06_04575, partial [Prevotellaceae bacterium]|nr:hypothetical protein [Candidatus Colivivens equi]
MKINKLQWEGGNLSLYVLKLFCAIGIVLQHATSISYENIILHPLMRAAVPCFLFISGYYLTENGKISLNKIDKQLRKIIKLIILYNVLF